MLLKPSVVGADSGSYRFNVEKEQSVPQCDGGGIGRRHFSRIAMGAAGNNDVLVYATTKKGCRRGKKKKQDAGLRMAVSQEEK